MITENQTGISQMPDVGMLVRKARNLRTLVLGYSRSRYGRTSKQFLINKISELLQEAIPEGQSVDVITFQSSEKNKVTFCAGDLVCVIDFSLTNNIYPYENKK
jgi:hypothetical protein